MNNKQYLGDGVFVAHDGYQLMLTVSDGMKTTDTIFLDPGVWAALKDYVERIELDSLRGRRQ